MCIRDRFTAPVLGAQDPAVFLVTYHHTQADADAGVGALTAAEMSSYTTSSGNETVYVRVTNSNTVTPCYATNTVNIHIEPKPDPTIVTINNINTICVDYTTHDVIRTLTLVANNPVVGNYTYHCLLYTSRCV